ncbi:MAG: hypothetical protein COT91_03275 [Candidatus Doudnabacteria bacterium CG10_big_fil_rev_8_21_14_0_10_41_10]|uniref:Inositol monophosphatase n=1 Tax=Candidatus Doudnabacteria bacterium CG10_big_fil_rev_8_21_14_0_10_41_10 TaxID=1974551 RepID=A0A2H0VDA8_9BACT|nr:MAG: hypothetical protein COT91_03275 [Candidatus Doudnabacteria bacterium CG10_big_fil_rev_8_21_14_0_10_41_10]
MEAASLSCAYVACGRYDAYIASRLPAWDNCAGALISKEADAKTTDFQGKPYRWDSGELVAVNPVLHKKIMKELRK